VIKLSTVLLVRSVSVKRRISFGTGTGGGVGQGNGGCSSLHCTEDELDTSAYNSEPGWLRRVKGQQPGRVVANCKTANSLAEAGNLAVAKGEGNFLPQTSFRFHR
jgi:hypothetical protein